jgi:hypothetical protein
MYECMHSQSSVMDAIMNASIVRCQLCAADMRLVERHCAEALCAAGWEHATTPNRAAQVSQAETGRHSMTTHWAHSGLTLACAADAAQ